jgi:hypothetical protein
VIIREMPLGARERPFMESDRTDGNRRRTDPVAVGVVNANGASAGSGML